MKKTMLVLGCLLFILVFSLPFGVILSACFGYVFELASYSFFAIITAMLAIATTLLCISLKEAVKNRIVKVLFALLAPLSLLSAVICMFECSRIWAVTSVIVCAGCCFYLFKIHVKQLILKTTALILSALIVSPISFFGFITMIFGNIGSDTVVQSLNSPNGTYYAEVIDSDQGALGGATYVDVYENDIINTCIFKISKKPQSVYYGEWGEFENMKIYWKDETSLVINSVEYIIK